MKNHESNFMQMRSGSMKQSKTAANHTIYNNLFFDSPASSSLPFCPSTAQSIMPMPKATKTATMPRQMHV